MKVLRWLLPFLLLLTPIHQAQAAGTLQGNLGIQITIGAGCTVNNSSNNGSTNSFGSISFGTYPSLANIVEGQSVGAGAGSSFGIQCANNTAYTVALNSGLAPSGNQRRMSGGASEFITYNLYQDAARTTPWGNGSNGANAYSGTGNGNNQDIVVYGRVPAQTTPTSGTYTDTVLVTVTW
ncbi:spore coat U domain-containing protein [Pseudomonas sp. JS3066]|jgi:spore coat protein U-like protein|uniref:Csu type fimbrial protein n=1 Tax=unclassified Pseudomonas TaxID=196821 RepID=UPI000EAA340F|nr:MULTISPECIES: spore coat U domain-containing protein [unclassified Pseudomonas]AYF88503.1 spore coat U domain-containing protein [Pseudomonas sp. DY-1]MDH4656589.1 spore coat U domain-containing protein [Pseudomonas sp. BN606]WVK93960.1 spore coat U domain-containing protein [Pseudomonas sp. JS3066]